MTSAHDATTTKERSAVTVLGIIGGGQLAKMTAQAAAQLGLEVVVLERTDAFPARSSAARSIVGDWNDARMLLALAGEVDVVTLENEFVDATALAELERAGHTLFPASRTLATVQDKLLQKDAFARAGLPLPRYRGVETLDDVRAAGRELGWPLVLKKRRNGYDGKGNATLRSESDVEAAWKRLGGAPHALYVEEFVAFERELAMIVVRGRDGASAAYPLVETINRDHVCNVVLAPAPVTADVARRADDIGRRAIDGVGGVGAFGLETFLCADGRVLVNEIAPRVHNTGHYTIEACATSQFENHVRAVMGWPLGSTAMRAPAACMVNLLGAESGDGTPHGLERALAVPGASVHVYGKSNSQRGRKMGHVTALGATIDAARATAERAASQIRFGGATR